MLATPGSEAIWPTPALAAHVLGGEWEGVGRHEGHRAPRGFGPKATRQSALQLQVRGGLERSASSVRVGFGAWGFGGLGKPAGWVVPPKNNTGEGGVSFKRNTGAGGRVGRGFELSHTPVGQFHLCGVILYVPHFPSQRILR